MAKKPLYQLLDPLLPEEYAALEADIAKRGVLVAVEIDDKGNTLDGHNRTEIAKRLGKPYKTVTRKFKTEAEKREHVIKLNLARRHFDPLRWGKAFKLLLEEKGVKRGKGGDRKSNATVALDSIESVAKELGVPVDTAKKRLSQADAFENLPPAQQKAIKSGKKKLTQVKREQKEKKRESRRAANRKQIAKAKPLAKAVAAKFATIVIDPPWDWGDEGDVDQMGRAKPTYETMSVEKLLELPVGDRADVDAHIYLWITNRSLPKGFQLLERWGFRYVTCLTWCKPSFGMGNYFRGQTEQVLFGVKGSQSLKRKDVGTWFASPRGPAGHSSKPIEFSELVESCSPGPYLEIFARSERKDWTSWGGEL